MIVPSSVIKLSFPDTFIADIITPFGMKGSMKLKKYMNGKGVSKHHRDNIPLLCNNKEVLWVTGVGLSEKIGVKTSPTHVVEFN